MAGVSDAMSFNIYCMCGSIVKYSGTAAVSTFMSDLYHRELTHFKNLSRKERMCNRDIVLWIGETQEMSRNKYIFVSKHEKRDTVIYII